MRGPAATVLAVLLAVTACSGEARPVPRQSASAPARPAATGPSCLDTVPVPAAAQSTTPGSQPMPALVLDCFGGSAQVRLSDLRGPAVINLWASWCAPCRTELPALQSYAERARGKVRVIGVVTRDRRDAAQSFIDDRHLTFPMLEDQRQELLTAVGKTALPVTLFVGADGRIVYVYNSTALDEVKLERMAADQLGVAVAA